MRIHSLILTVLFGASLCAEAAAANVPDVPGKDWTLVWSDEFDRDGAPDARYWRYEYSGFLRNKEEQWYTNSPRNIFVKDGMLHIVARLEEKPLPNPNYEEGAKNWKKNRKLIEITSAGLVSNNDTTFCYGRIVMRAKMPRCGGAWPAFWTVGADPKHPHWPDNGEIDIVEYMCKVPQDKTWMQGAMHWKSPEGKYRQKNGRNRDVAGLDAGFHLYGIEWNREKIDFFVDGKVFLSVPIEQCGNAAYNAFRVPHRMLLNLAMGGTLGGKVDRAALPAEYLIDYVRVYQKKDGSGARK